MLLSLENIKNSRDVHLQSYTEKMIRVLELQHFLKQWEME